MNEFYSRRNEVDEAVIAGNDALYHLYNAQKMLDKAAGWGIADILGGGMFVTFMKQDKMHNAQYEIQLAKDAMNRLSYELRDIYAYTDVRIPTDGFLGFADYFFDGVIADWMVQSRINDARRQVNEAIARVEGILDALNEETV